MSTSHPDTTNSQSSSTSQISEQNLQNFEVPLKDNSQQTKRSQTPWPSNHSLQDSGDIENGYEEVDIETILDKLYKFQQEQPDIFAKITDLHDLLYSVTKQQNDLEQCLDSISEQQSNLRYTLNQSINTNTKLLQQHNSILKLIENSSSELLQQQHSILRSIENSNSKDSRYNCNCVVSLIQKVKKSFCIQFFTVTLLIFGSIFGLSYALFVFLYSILIDN